MKKNIFIITFIIIKFILIHNSCIDNQNYCKKCHPLTNKCIICKTDNFFPNNEGGCTGKCTIGKNYCNKCDLEEKLCIECQSNFYSDNVGGCSIVPNCESSYNGKCNKCKEEFILIGDDNGFKICKDKNSLDFKNCKTINKKTGLCQECNEGFYLNTGDFKCSSTENCFKSTYGICESCSDGYYFEKKMEKCILIEDSFAYCKQTIDGKNCDLCKNNYYLAEDGQCTDTIMCSKTEKGKCIQCSKGAILLKDNTCSLEENCLNADKDTALCNSCMKNFYLDNKDKRCKSNRENNEFKHCLIANEGCRKCEDPYNLGDDLKCIKTEFCSESENEICTKCARGYYLGLDHKCTKVQHCIYSGNTDYACDECEDNYYYNNLNQTCMLVKDDTFKNCKMSTSNDTICSVCKSNYYLNLTDFLCYDNTNKGDILYRCSRPNPEMTECRICEDNYYLGSGDKKCSNITKCKISENGDKCLACEVCYCLDLKSGKCFDNEFLYEENQKIYIACNRTNKDGTACEQCLEGYEVNEEGLCFDVERCTEKENNTCIKCKEDPPDYLYYCANKYYGCLQNYLLSNCLRCDNIFDLYVCTECKEGYELNKYGLCQKIYNNN